MDLWRLWTHLCVRGWLSSWLVSFALASLPHCFLHDRSFDNVVTYIQLVCLNPGLFSLGQETAVQLSSLGTCTNLYIMPEWNECLTWLSHSALARDWKAAASHEALKEEEGELKSRKLMAITWPTFSEPHEVERVRGARVSLIPHQVYLHLHWLLHSGHTLSGHSSRTHTIRTLFQVQAQY